MKTAALADFLRDRHLTLDIVVAATGIPATTIAHEHASPELVRGAAMLLGRTVDQLDALVRDRATTPRAAALPTYAEVTTATEVQAILHAPDESRTLILDASFDLSDAAADQIVVDPDETKDEEPVAPPVRTSGKPADIDDTARETPKAKRKRPRKPK